MNAAQLDELQICRTDKGVRWVLPMRSTMHPFRGPWYKRVGSWAFIMFGVFWIGCGAGGLAVMWAKMRGCFPLDLLNACFLAGVIFGALLYLATSFVMGFVSIILAFPAHTEFTLSSDYLEEAAFNGRFRWVTRCRVGDIACLTVHTPPTSSEHALRCPLDERPASLVVECLPPGKTRQLGSGHSHRIISELVVGLTQELSARRPDPMAVFLASTPEVITPSVVDTMDRGYLDADDPTPPDGCRYQLQTEPDGLLITSRPASAGLIQLLRMPEFRCGLWLVIAGVLGYLLLRWLPIELPPRLATVFLVFSGGFGCFMTGGVIWIYLWHYSYRVTPDYLCRTWHCLWFHWTRRIPRSRIAALRIAYRTADKGRVRNVLEILGADGKKIEFTSGSIPLLRFLGTHLRLALGVEAASVVADCLDPQSAAYHVQDQVAPPAHCPVVCQETGEAIILAKRPAQLNGSLWVGAGLSVVLLLAAIFLPVLAIPRTDPKEHGSIIMLAVIFGGVALVLAATMIFDFFERYLFMVTPSALTFTRKTVFGTREEHFDRESLVAIRSTAGATVGAMASYRVVVIRAEGKPVEFVGYSDPAVPRYVATQLRRVLGLPAMGPAEVLR